MSNGAVVPRTLWQFPTFSVPSFIEDIEELLPTANLINGLSVSEDEQKVYIEAAVPGVDPNDVEVTFADDVVLIRAEKKEEAKTKKFQRKASNSFLYRITVDDVDANIEPEAVCKNGIMTLILSKLPKMKPQKIAVKAA